MTGVYGQISIKNLEKKLIAASNMFKSSANFGFNCLDPPGMPVVAEPQTHIHTTQVIYFVKDCDDGGR